MSRIERKRICAGLRFAVLMLTALLPASFGQDKSVKVQSTLSQRDDLAHYVKAQCPGGIHLVHPIRVQLHAVIDLKGNVRTVEFVKGDPRFRKEALRAVKAWRYKPVKVRGERVEGKRDIELSFSCPGNM